MRTFVTSMSAAGYEQYGKTFLERAGECLPGKLVVYTESGVPVEPHGVEWRDLHETDGYDWFQDGIARFQVAHGRVSGAARNYRYDIAKFCRKSFAQIDAASVEKGELWWIDADVVFREPIPESFFSDALEGVFLAYLGRPGWHSCLSLAGFNNRHEDAARFWANYTMLYVTGQVLLLPEWHDSYIVDFIRNGLGVSSRNMAANIPLENGPVNVFDRVLDGKAIHKKGNLKKEPARYEQLMKIVRERQPRRVLEIGTWDGGRAIAMNEAAPGIEYHGFDLFELADETTDEEEMNVKAHHHAQAVAQRLTEAQVNAKLYVGNTRESLPRFMEQSNKKFDLIFIDGGHSVETIASDLACCLKMIEPHGVIVMDDWYEGPIDTEQFGCNKPLLESGLAHEVLPIADPVKGGGVVKMAVIPC